MSSINEESLDQYSGTDEASCVKSMKLPRALAILLLVASTHCWYWPYTHGAFGGCGAFNVDGGTGSWEIRMEGDPRKPVDM